MDPEVAWEVANPAGRVESLTDPLLIPPPPPGYVVWNFAVGRFILKPDHQSRLITVALALAKQTDRILIYGHASSSGSAERNQHLAFARAIATRDYLVGQGIPQARTELLSNGRNFPAYPNDTPENMARNRGVQIELLITT